MTNDGDPVPPAGLATGPIPAGPGLGTGTPFVLNSDPSTGAVRTDDTGDIACWFIDTDDDGQSVFVRHADFLYGGKDTKEGPYDDLITAESLPGPVGGPMMEGGPGGG